QLLLLFPAEGGDGAGLILDVQRDDAIHQLEPAFRQRHYCAPPVLGIARAGDQAGLLQPVQAVGHAARRDHQRLEQVRGRQGVGRPGAAQRRKDVELTLLQAVALKERLQMGADDQPRGMDEAADNLHRQHIELGQFPPPLGNSLLDSVHRYLDIKILCAKILGAYFVEAKALIMARAATSRKDTNRTAWRAFGCLLAVGTLLALSLVIAKLADQAAAPRLSFLMAAMAGAACVLTGI